MKKIVLTAVAIGTVLATTAGVSHAQEMGRVLSSTPVLEQIAVPRQVCATQTVVSSGQPGGGGALLGAAVGGAAGNMVGRGNGRAVATLIGAVGGALLGNQVEAHNSYPVAQNVQQCSTVTEYQSQPVAYNVTYEYAGRHYTVQMANEPGPYVPVSVSANYQQPVYQQPTYQQPAYAPARPVAVAYPEPSYVQPVYSQPAYEPAPVGVSISPTAVALGVGALVAAPFIYRAVHPRHSHQRASFHGPGRRWN